MDNNTRPNEASPQMPLQYAPMAAEINLIDIWRILMCQIWLILGITILCTALAVGAALLLPREYRVEVITMPPLTATAEKLNVLNLSGSADSSENVYFFKVKTMDLYQEFINNLQSNRLRRQFFDENDLARFLSEKEDHRSVEDVFKQEFNEKLAIKRMKKNKDDHGVLSITLEGGNPDQLVGWLNSFVELADKKTIFAQTQSFQTKVKRAKENVSHRMESVRITEKFRRLDLIARMKEAVIVAEELGWVERPENPGVLYEQAKINRIDMSFSLQNIPLYLRGSRALQAEIDVLEQRKNDDPFILDLRDLQEKLDFLSSVEQDVENIHAMRLDRAAIEDNKPIKPKRKLIVVLGLVLGFLLSILLAFIRNMIVVVKQDPVQK